MTQRELASRLGVSQATVGRLLTGRAPLGVDAADAMARACGHRLVIRVVPGDGIGLRDSGQLALAQAIQRGLHSTWQVRLEVPVAPPRDRRAVDMLLMHPDELVAIEIERWLRDRQAQFRAAQLKRLALAERTGHQVRLVLGLPDTVAARRAIEPFKDLLARDLPISSRQALGRLRSGEPIGGDALLWIRR